MNRKSQAISALLFSIGLAILQGGCFEKMPNNLWAQAEGKNVHLFWNDRSSKEDGFYVYRRPAKTGDFRIIAVTPPDSEEYLDKDAGPDKDYEYRICAFRKRSISPGSNTVRVRTKPNAPSDLMITYPSRGHISLSWQDNSQVEDCYTVGRRETTSENWVVLNSCLPPNTTVFIDTAELDCKKTYEYRVAAYIIQRGFLYSDYSYISSSPCQDK